MQKNTEFTVKYERGPGSYNFITNDGAPVTALSYDTWDNYRESLNDSSLPDEGYIVSPELITCSDIEHKTWNTPSIIRERISIVQEASSRRPNALFLLGTPTGDDHGIVRNSLALIKNGYINGCIDKRFGMVPGEDLEFSSKPRPQSKLLKLGYGALICADIFYANPYRDNRSGKLIYDLLSPDTETVIMSSCWAIPICENKLNPPKSKDIRFKDALEGAAVNLFNNYHKLEEIIVVDRSASVSPVPSYTAQFKRK